LDYYAKPYENDGCWIGTIAHDRVHGDDIEVIGAFSFGGKRARAYLKSTATRRRWNELRYSEDT